MDKKTRFFKTTLLLQFVPALLMGILILSNYRPQKLLNVRGLHPYEFNYAYAFPLIFFGLCVLVAILTLFLKEDNVSEDEVDVQKKVRQQNFWKFAFYCNVFFLGVITIVSIMLWDKGPIVIYQVVFFYSLVFSRSLLVILISLITASFLLVAGIYWKSNRTMGVFILFFGFLIICISLTYEGAFVYEFMGNSQRYIYERDHRGEAPAVAEESEEYTEESEDEHSEVEKSKLISSWNSLIEDWGGLKGKYDFYDVRILMGRSLDNHITINDYFYLVQYVDNLSENPDELYSGFEKYRSVFYDIISPQTYRAANFDKIIDGLLLAYNDIGAENEKLNEIYKGMDVSSDNPGPTMEQYYATYEKHFSSATIEKLQGYKLSGGSKFLTADLMWFYSFWARRNHEGNSKEIAIILNEIKDYYDPNSNSDEE